MSQVTTPGHIRFVLPGEWANLPLEVPELTRKFAQRLILDRVGRDDRLAALRRETVTHLCDTADRARASGAHTLAIGLELVPGIPLAASMVARDIPWPVPGPDAPSGAAAAEDSEEPTQEPSTAERLARAFPGAEVVELASGPATRTRESGVLRGLAEETSSVSVAYRIPRPDSDDLLHLRFTGPDMGRPDLIAQLFEAVAGSVEFTRRRVPLEARP